MLQPWPSWLDLTSSGISPHSLRAQMDLPLLSLQDFSSSRQVGRPAVSNAGSETSSDTFRSVSQGDTRLFSCPCSSTFPPGSISLRRSHRHLPGGLSGTHGYIWTLPHKISDLRQLRLFWDDPYPSPFSLHPCCHTHPSTLL